jgi:hypothetical protein
MTMLRFASAFVGALAVCATSSTAIPPPPPDPQADESREAINKLASFFGVWEAREDTYTADGQKSGYWYHTRTVELVGNVVLITNGTRGEGWTSVQLNIVAYDPKSKTYRLFLPGYRNTFAAETREVVPLDRPNDYTLQWSVPYNPVFGTPPEWPLLRTTVMLANGQWNEYTYKIGPDGKATPTGLGRAFKRIGAPAPSPTPSK